MWFHLLGTKEISKQIGYQIIDWLDIVCSGFKNQ